MFNQFRDQDGKWSWETFFYYAKGWLAVLVALSILVGGGVILSKIIGDKWYEFRTAEDYIGTGTEQVIVQIPKGASLNEIGSILFEAGVIKSTKAFDQASGQNPEAVGIQAGRFQLLKELPAATAIEMLLDQDNRVRIRVTIPEGLATSQQLPIIVDATGIAAADLEAIVKDPSGLPLLGAATMQVEGFLFPDTYEVDDEPSASKLLITQVQRFNEIAGDINLNNRAEAMGLTPRQVVIVASLLEKEARSEEDMKKVAAVIYNRLDQDMLLQLDSTVHYGLNDFTTVTTTDAQRATDTPYNTYLHKGLPTGPISNPGKAALEAALTPADTDDLYFVTVNLDTGETKFATNYEDHEKNVAEFQAWCQANTGRC